VAGKKSVKAVFTYDKSIKEDPQKFTEVIGKLVRAAYKEVRYEAKR